MKGYITTCAVLLFLVCFFFVNTGQTGYMPPPDGSGILVIKGNAAYDSEQREAVVYGSGEIGQLDTNGNGTFIVKWYTALEGQTKEGVLTIISTQPTSLGNRNPKHILQRYTIPNGGNDEIDIRKQRLKHGM